jgi:hypothetical protein
LEDKERRHGTDPAGQGTPWWNCCLWAQEDAQALVREEH